MTMRFHGIVALALAALPLPAAEMVVFASGQRMHMDRHERVGDRMLLYRGEGVLDVPAAVVAGFEPDESAAPAPEPAPEPVAPAGVAGTALAATPAPEPSHDPRTLVREAAVRAGLPPEFVESVALVESAFQPGAVSPKGAIGVMQLMPETARTLGADPHDLHQNIDAGTRLLRELLLKYDGDVGKALAAYNAGEGAVDRYQGVPPYDETLRYVDRVIRTYQRATGK